jgi:hypothetical protein
VLGGIAGLLVILDWLMPREQKDRLKDMASTLWLWLSYQRSWPYLQKLTNPRAFDALFLSACALGLVAFVMMYFFRPLRVADREPAETAEVMSEQADWFQLWGPIILCTVAIVGYAITRRWLLRGFAWVVSADTTKRLFARSGAALGIVYGSLLLGIGSLVGTQFGLMHLGWLSVPIQIVFGAVFLVVWMAGVSGFFLMYAIILMWLYISTIFVMIFLFKGTQYVLLRMLEYDKGPLLAAAALLTAFGSVLKLVTG